MAEAAQGGWTRFFKKTDGMLGEDVLTRVLGGLGTLFEGGSLEETLKHAREALKRVFSCQELSIFIHDPEVQPHMDEGRWVLTVKTGFGEGNRVSESDARSLDEVKPGRPIPYNELIAQKVALKAIALAFKEDTFYGADIEKKIVLLQNPTPNDDLGSGDLSVLAIPLRHVVKTGRFEEKRKVGVLALFGTPCRTELGDLERAVRTMLGHALTAPQVALKDAVTGLYTEAHFRDLLESEFGLYDLTGGKVKGGIVFGCIDALALYRQTLESEGDVRPEEVSQKISEVYRGIGSTIWARCRNHALDESHVYKSGAPARIGKDGFAILLPLLKDHELVQIASRLSKDVVKQSFEGEQLLATGDITISLRVLPFGLRNAKAATETLKLLKETVEEIEREQSRARRDPEALAQSVGTVKVWSEAGSWMDAQEWRNQKKG